MFGELELQSSAGLFTWFKVIEKDGKALYPVIFFGDGDPDHFELSFG